MNFGLDSRLYKIGIILKDIIAISFVWVLFSLPIVTIGASTAASYYCMTRKLSDRDGYFFKDYLKSFKENLARATVIFLVLSAILFIVVWNILLPAEFGTVFNIIVRVAQWLVVIQLTFVFMYAFPLIARFELSIKDCIKAAFLMANRYLIATLTILAFFLIIVLSSVFFWMITPFIIGIYIYASSIMFLKVFKKHYPGFDAPESDS